MHLLDTHVWVWWLAQSPKIPANLRKRLDRLGDDGMLSISSISLWEIGNLYRLGRIRLSLPLEQWLEAATASSFVKVEAISVPITADLATLPDSFHRDPADRIIVSTSRVLDRPLFTFDRKIADSGLVEMANA